MNLNQVTLPAFDIQVSIRFYKTLGLEQIVDAPHYARFVSTPGNVTLSIHQSDRKGSGGGAVVYFECENLDTVVDELIKKGIAFTRLPTNQPWLWREARLKDPSNNELCLFWAGENRLSPPWKLQGQQ